MGNGPLVGVERRLDFISGQVAEFVRNEPYRTVIGGNLDGSGNVDVLLFECRELTRFRLHRVVLQTVGHGPLNPYASVTGWLGLYRNDVGQPGNLIDYVPAGQTIFPSLFEASTDEAEVLQPNSALWLRVVGGPPGDQLLARVQGTLHSDYRVTFQAAPQPAPIVVQEPELREAVKVA